MISVYFAGPDIFRPDYPAVAARIEALCAGLGLRPLLPDDGGREAAESRAIFRRNLALVRAADGLVANLNPFRSPVEPDSGTVFECAFALALGKFVVGIVEDGRDLVTKLGGRPAPDGWRVEDFGLPLNLMLAHGLTALAPTLEEAVKTALRLAAGPRVRLVFRRRPKANGRRRAGGLRKERTFRKPWK